MARFNFQFSNTPRRGTPRFIKSGPQDIHHIKDWVKLGAIEIIPVATDLQLADAMTKPLSRERQNFLLEKYYGGLAPVF